MIRAIPATYPLFAALANESGVVVIDVKIKPDGTVEEANIVDGHKLFRAVAQRSARNWVFNSVADLTLSRTARLTFSFRFVPGQTVTPYELLPVFMPPYAVESRGTTAGYVTTPNIHPPDEARPKRQTKRRTRARLTSYPPKLKS